MGDKADGTWGELNANPSEDGWILGEESYGYFDDMNWEPAPIDANPGYLDLPLYLTIDYRKTTSGDIVSMLLNIYENTEPFLKELQVILADKLLSSKEYDVDREVRVSHFRINNRLEMSNYSNYGSEKLPSSLAM